MIGKILSSLRFRKEIEDYDLVDDKIKKDLVFQGTNLWVLMFAIIIACVGLNINSTAVIIGAMLISPLMGPINGMGYSIATSDIHLLKRSLKNFGFAVVTSLVTSTLYFAITPLSTASSELLSRTSPTVYDVVIAFFGGMAGMVAISSQQKGNVIPGVAIATALMPPLCTAGFGIATLQLSFLFGALYLFTIYTVCMTIAGVVIAQVIGFPIRKNMSDTRKKRINHIISFTLLITILPSIYLAYRLVQNEKFNNEAKKYINGISVIENNYLIDSEVKADKKIIQLTYAGISLSSTQKERLIERAKDFSLKDATIIINEGFSFNSYLEGEGKNTESDKLKKEIHHLNTVIQHARAERDSLLYRTSLGKKILEEITPFYPDIQGCAYTEAFMFREADSIPLKEDIIFVQALTQIEEEDQKKIEAWLQRRLEKENLKIYFDNGSF